MTRETEKSSKKNTLRSWMLKYSAYAAAALSAVTLGLLFAKRYRERPEKTD